MSDTPTPPDSLPDGLVAQVDLLDARALSALRAYVEQRLDVLRTPFEAEIEETAAGEVVEIEAHGSYALVRMHPPSKGDGDTDRVALFHVQQERQIDGTKSLHWTYLGDVHDPARIRCHSCGRTLDEDATVCPHCGSDIRDAEEEH